MSTSTTYTNIKPFAHYGHQSNTTIRTSREDIDAVDENLNWNLIEGHRIFVNSTEQFKNKDLEKEIVKILSSSSCARRSSLLHCKSIIVEHDMVLLRTFAMDSNNIEVSRRQSAKYRNNRTNSIPDSYRDNLYGMRTSKLSESIKRRLLTLANEPDRWRGPGSKRLNSESLRNFLEAWRRIFGKAVEPFLTLAPAGNIYAEWHASWRRHLDLEFAPDGKVYFGLFHSQDTVEGKSDLEDVISSMLARRTNPFRWKVKGEEG
jgi:hypothetical protein